MFLKRTDKSSLSAAIEKMERKDGETFMLLLSEQNVADVPALIEFFNEKKMPFFGGIFPGLIYQDNKIDEGGILKKFDTQGTPYVIKNIANSRLDGINKIPIMVYKDKYTAITFTDGLTSNINYFLESLNNQLGSSVSFVGGGAGSLSLKQQPCLFTDEGFFQDAAIVCIVKKKARLGVRHGWEKLEGPMIATKTEGNTIHQLNWENAFDVYKKVVEKDAGVELNAENFFSVAKSYPFGIFREDMEDIVRDPISVDENGHLFCVGEVPPNTVLYVLKGETDNLIDAAGKAIADCKRGQNGSFQADDTLIVDCISRTLFLENRFPEELTAIRSQLNIQTDSEEPYGILSLGEISSFGIGLLEFFNKTIVVSTLSS